MFIIRAEQRERITSLTWMTELFLVQSRMPLAFFTAKAQHWPLFNLLPTGRTCLFLQIHLLVSLQSEQALSSGWQEEKRGQAFERGVL